MTRPGDGNPPGPCAVFVDLGTTNTRVWLARGDKVLARGQAQVGVRDTARDGSPVRLRETLKTIIAALIDEGRAAGAAPQCVIAAGMITSSLGLAEVPHVPAPAGVAQLAAATRQYEFPDVTPLPVLLVPGVRTGTLAPGDPATTCDADLMRGEETLCAGLVALGLAEASGVVLNLGSHWKAIRLDSAGQVTGSITSLSGELVYAAQTNTILASAVPQQRPDALDPDWVAAGMREQRRSGLARALFCVRLLEQSHGGQTPAQRMAFLVGAFIAADFDALAGRGALGRNTPVTLVGSAALAEAWAGALRPVVGAVRVVSEVQTELALLAGLRAVLNAAPPRPTPG